MDALQAFYVLAFLLLIVSSTSGSTSVESLLDQLRKKQIQGMIAEQNKASTLKLPEKLAEASFNEAKMRALKANGKSDEINATPYSPFDAEKGPKNLGYLGRGYDVLHGDPLDDAGRVDPGFRLPVISLEYLQNVFSPDGEYRMPDNADVVMEPSALFSSTYNEIRTVSDYKQTLTEDVKTTSGFGLDAGFVSVSGEFTQSKSYQNAKENMKKGGTVNIDIIGRATVYKARLHTFGDSLKVSPVLQKAIGNLPSGSCVDRDIPKYLQLIQSFGTHYTSVVTMGAKAVQRLSMGSAESLQLKKLGITTSDVVSLTVGLRAKGISASATYGKETSKSSETTKSQHLSKMDIQKKEFYIGGEPPSEASSLDEQGSTASLRQWGRSAFERPVPIQYQLRNIDELFQQSYLPKVTNLDEKKKCLRKALRTYCSKIAVDKQDCVSYEDGSDEPNAIRYGDFISLKRASSTNYLTVKEDFPQFKAGSTEQLMKVVPVDRNAAWKYGKALHYGEPFNLISEYGGENGVASCGSGQNKQLKLFSYGKVRITCSKSDNPVGEWTVKPRHWCQKQYEEAMVSGKLTPRECQAKCLELTNGECQAVQWLETDERCYYCSDTSKIKPFDKDQYIYFRYRVYVRDNKSKLQERPVQIATLYFTSPAGKKEGEIVLRNDKVYIGVNSYEERKPLFDVHRPAFLKVESGDVSVVEDDFTTSNARQVSGCSSGVNLQGLSKFLACNFWWQIQSTPKALRTYPNIHYEQLTRVQQG